MFYLDQIQKEAKEQKKPLAEVINLFVFDCLFDADISQTSRLAQELRKQMYVEKL